MDKKIFSRGLSAKKVQQLLQEPGWCINNELAEGVSGKASFIDVIYSHPDGRTLTLFNDGNGRLYNSEEHWLALLASLKELEDQEPVHILREGLLLDQNFPDVAPDLANQLAEKLNLTTAQLDRSRASLELIDRRIQTRERNDLLEKAIFTPLVAYVGEVIRNLTHARWEMRLASDGETWEPWLVTYGQSFPISLMLYDELYEKPDCSVSAIADVCL